MKLGIGILIGLIIIAAAVAGVAIMAGYGPDLSFTEAAESEQSDTPAQESVAQGVDDMPSSDEEESEPSANRDETVPEDQPTTAQSGSTAASQITSSVAQSCEPVLTSLLNLNVRKGPGINYEVVGVLMKGTEATITGESPDGAWWRIECPAGYGSQCWAYGGPGYSSSSGTDCSELAIAEVPLPPVALPAERLIWDDFYAKETATEEWWHSGSLSSRCHTTTEIRFARMLDDFVAELAVETTATADVGDCTTPNGRQDPLRVNVFTGEGIGERSRWQFAGRQPIYGAATELPWYDGLLAAQNIKSFQARAQEDGSIWFFPAVSYHDQWSGARLFAEFNGPQSADGVPLDGLCYWSRITSIETNAPVAGVAGNYAMSWGIPESPCQ